MIIWTSSKAIKDSYNLSPSGIAFEKKTLPWDISRESVKCFKFMQFHGIVSFSITDITVCFKYTIKYFNHPIESPKVIPSTAASPVLQTKGPIAESRVTRVASFFDGRMVGFRRFRKPIAAGCLVFLKLPSRPLMKKKTNGEILSVFRVSLQDYKK